MIPSGIGDIHDIQARLAVMQHLEQQHHLQRHQQALEQLQLRQLQSQQHMQQQAREQLYLLRQQQSHQSHSLAPPSPGLNPDGALSALQAHLLEARARTGAGAASNKEPAPPPGRFF
jgi:hypothetical protein